MNIKRSVVVRANFVGYHSWPGCPHEDVAFLRNMHRHIFYVEIRLGVEKEDRQLEFFQVQHQLKQILSKNYEVQCFDFSCETLADNIYQRLVTTYPTLWYVSVFEDNENGAFFEIER